MPSLRSVASHPTLIGPTITEFEWCEHASPATELAVPGLAPAWPAASRAMRVRGQPQLGQGFVPRALYSLIAMRSCVDSDASIGSPRPPQACQVSMSNWYLPRYLPLGDTARGLPPDSHFAIFWRMRG